MLAHVIYVLPAVRSLDGTIPQQLTRCIDARVYPSVGNPAEPVPRIYLHCHFRRPALQARGKWDKARARGRVCTGPAVIFSLVLPNAVVFGNLQPLVFANELLRSPNTTYFLASHGAAEHFIIILNKQAVHKVCHVASKSEPPSSLEMMRIAELPYGMMNWSRHFLSLRASFVG